MTNISRDRVEALLSEFDQEMAGTKKMLERLPEGKLAWKPHEKSSTLGKLANHLAAIPVGAAFVISGQGSKGPDLGSKVEILEAFQRRITATRDALTATNDDHLAKTIRVTPVLIRTREAAFKWWISHMIHHRGQLSVYLRLLDVPVPGMYGAAAAEQ